MNERENLASNFLSVSQVSKSFGATKILREVSFNVAQGDIACLLGPSGCGKTTLLRIISGLEIAESGVVFCAGENLADVPIHERNFGLVFQDFALFPHRNVEENIAFGLRMHKAPRDLIQKRVREALELVNLPSFGKRRVHELSGGEQQRVALARSLALQPRLLMLDEPLGSLDRALRDELMVEIRRIIKQIGVTALYVTHDQHEAFAVADQMIVMNQGQILQHDAPETVHRQPATAFVAQFLGLTNLVAGVVISADPILRVATSAGDFVIDDDSKTQRRVGETLTVVVRPNAAVWNVSAGSNVVRGKIVQHIFRGDHYQIDIRPAGTDASWRMLVSAEEKLPNVGEIVSFSLRATELNVISE